MGKEASACDKIKRYTLSFSAKEMYENPRCVSEHLKCEDDAFVCAEAAYLRYPSKGCTKLFVTVNAIYGYNEKTKTLYNLSTNTVLDFSLSSANAVVSYWRDGAWEDILVNDEAVYCLKSDGISSVNDYYGGTYAAVYGERIFMAKGMTVYYSQPLSSDNWRESRYEGGSIELPAAGGNIFGMVSYKDKLWLFREQGEVTMLRMMGDDVNAKATSVPLNCGRLTAGSVAVAGEKIYFIANKGLYAFNGVTCELVESRIINSRPNDRTNACAMNGRYYAVGDEYSGRVYCYDPTTKRAHTANLGATCIATFKYKGYILQGDYVSLVVECGMPLEGEDNSTVTLSDIRPPENAASMMIDGIFVEGIGATALTISSDSCRARMLKFPLNTFQKIYPPINGSRFQISLMTNSLAEEYQLKSVTLYAREGRR